MNDKDTFLKALGNLAMTFASAAVDMPAAKRIEEIDEQMDELKAERAALVSTLISDELRAKTETKPLMEQFFGEQGRIVKCAGRKIGQLHTAHPECKFKNDIHPEHDFRLKD